MTTNPWARTDRTITYADHKLINQGEVLLLIEYVDMDEAGIYIWLHEDRVVWQVLKKEVFDKCLKLIQSKSHSERQNSG